MRAQIKTAEMFMVPWVVWYDQESCVRFGDNNEFCEPSLDLGNGSILQNLNFCECIHGCIPSNVENCIKTESCQDGVAKF